MIFNIVFLSVLKLGLLGYFVAIILSSILSIIQLLIFGNVIRDCISNKLNMSLLKEMLVFSFPMILNNVSWWIINSSDKVMIEYFDSAAASGIYSVAAKIPSIIISLTTIFNQAWIISSVREYDNNKDPNFFSKIFSVFNCMLVLSSSLIVLIIKPFMSIYVGSSFVECWIFVPFLLLGSIFQSYATFFGAIYTSAKKNVNVMSTTLVAAIINIVLNILLIPRIGVQGAVFATAISYFLIFIFRMYDTQKYIKFSIEYFNVICSVLLLSVQCCIMIKIQHNIVYALSAVLFLVILFVNMNTLKNLKTMILKKINFRNIGGK
ncbi:lipopolysaccharide biosynthesis protein [Hespellia stercorisuis]|uniref:Polysaccharide biosynthesis protein n=1 Tax=Hespellia stercorisuis DSM 15480 TaxID=1121950 RepID=A0A1M6QRR9_9FIRM|nr:polysaccharide biosynthesis C-terminal domain-containing protein [Hespellia stercorisuis]SHK23009.1 Polysaccharide biosynthesis protein [Hespellia stercorisuis DSM 15480]